MKKTYIHPEMDVVELNMTRTLLAGSVTGGDVLDVDAGDGVSGMAPSLDGLDLLDMEQLDGLNY